MRHTVAAMSSPYDMILSFRILAVLLLLRVVNATEAPSTTVLSPSTSTWARTVPSSIGFSSAVEVEASASAEAAQSARSSAKAMAYYPVDLLTELPDYAVIEELVLALPAEQAHAKGPDTKKLMADLRLSSQGNSSSADDTSKALDSVLRVIVVGDSISQGQEGDWTWRYRIWQWFQSNGIDMRFVGPYKGTVEAEKPTKPQPPQWYDDPPTEYEPKTSGGYAKGADAAFVANSKHFSVWGRAAAVDKFVIQDVLEENPADLMLLMLGFNDMGWFFSDADGTIDSIDTLVDSARAANPKMKFAIANVPQRTFIGGRQDLVTNTRFYNALLKKALPEWSTTQSPIHMVDVEKYYECNINGCPSGKWNTIQ